MRRSKIIKDIVQNNKSVSTALQELLVITHELDNKELNRWIRNELTGYNSEDELPSYRKNLPNTILYSGQNGLTNVNNLPLPIQYFGEYKEQIVNLNFMDSCIGEIENAIENTKDCNMGRNLTMFAGIISKNTNNQITCFNIFMKFGNNAFEYILSNVRVKIIDSLLLLEKKFGILDELYFEEDKMIPDKTDKVNKQINSIIFSDGARY